MTRFRAFTDLQSRDGSLTRGARVINGYVEEVNGRPYVQKRPALTLLDATLTGVGGGVWYDPVNGTTGTSALGFVGIEGTSHLFRLLTVAGAGTWGISTNGLSTPDLFLGGNTGNSGMLAYDDYPVIAYAYATPTSAPVGYDPFILNNVHVQDSLGSDYYTNYLTAGNDIVPVGGGLAFVNAGGGDVRFQITYDLGATWLRLETLNINSELGTVGDQIGFIGSVCFVYNEGTVYYSSSPLTLSSWSYTSVSGLGGISSFALAYDGTYIYAIGGADAAQSSFSNKVYRSTNGTSFTLINGSPPWVANAFGSAIIIGSTLYYAPGFSSGISYIFEVWKSTDGGLNWTDITPSETPSSISQSRLTNVNGTLTLMNYNKVYQYSEGSDSWSYVPIGTLANPNSVIADFLMTPT